MNRYVDQILIQKEACQVTSCVWLKENIHILYSLPTFSQLTWASRASVTTEDFKQITSVCSLDCARQGIARNRLL